MEAVALRAGDERERDAEVPRGGLDDHRLRREHAPSLQVVDERGRRAILDRSARALPLELQEQGPVATVALRVEAGDRRVADLANESLQLLDGEAR